MDPYQNVDFIWRSHDNKTNTFFTKKFEDRHVPGRWLNTQLVHIVIKYFIQRKVIRWKWFSTWTLCTQKICQTYRDTMECIRRVPGNTFDKGTMNPNWCIAKYNGWHPYRVFHPITICVANLWVDHIEIINHIHWRISDITVISIQCLLAAFAGSPFTHPSGTFLFVVIVYDRYTDYWQDYSAF